MPGRIHSFVKSNIKAVTGAATISAIAGTIALPALPALAAGAGAAALAASFALNGNEFFSGGRNVCARVAEASPYRYDGPYAIRGDAFAFADRERFLFDGEGVIMYRPFPGGDALYNPAYVGYQALCAHAAHLSSVGNAGYLAIFEKCRDWLARNAAETDGTAFWPYNFDYEEGGRLVSAPWNSCIASGLAVSALLRAFALSNDAKYLELAQKAANGFFIPLAEGGFLHSGGSRSLSLEEYPLDPPVHVLDGELFAFIALYEMDSATKCPSGQGSPAATTRYGEFFAKLAEALEKDIRVYDLAGMWSMYGTHGILATASYHRLNAALVEAVGTLADNAALRRVSKKWSTGARSMSQRFYIYSAYKILYYAFLVRKNWK